MFAPRLPHSTNFEYTRRILNKLKSNAVVVLSGDFAQICPVIHGREHITAEQASVCHHPEFSGRLTLTLRQQMRQTHVLDAETLEDVARGRRRPPVGTEYVVNMLNAVVWNEPIPSPPDPHADKAARVVFRDLDDAMRAMLFGVNGTLPLPRTDTVASRRGKGETPAPLAPIYDVGGDQADAERLAREIEEQDAVEAEIANVGVSDGVESAAAAAVVDYIASRGAAGAGGGVERATPLRVAVDTQFESTTGRMKLARDRAEQFMSKAFITCHRSEADKINAELTERLTTTGREYPALDRQAPARDGRQDVVITALNSARLSQKLHLRIGMPVLLTHNIDPSNGLANGSRGIVDSVYPNVVGVTLQSGQKVCMVRVTENIGCRVNARGLVVQRRQFPLRVAFAMTAHRAQGQSLDAVTFVPGRRVFAHGMVSPANCPSRTPRHTHRPHSLAFLVPPQMYTACSRVRDIDNLYLYAPQSATGLTRDWHVRQCMLHTVMDRDVDQVVWDPDDLTYTVEPDNIPRFWRADIRRLFNVVSPDLLRVRGWSLDAWRIETDRQERAAMVARAEHPGTATQRRGGRVGGHEAEQRRHRRRGMDAFNLPDASTSTDDDDSDGDGDGVPHRPLPIGTRPYETRADAETKRQLAECKDLFLGHTKLWAQVLLALFLHAARSDEVLPSRPGDLNVGDALLRRFLDNGATLDDCNAIALRLRNTDLFSTADARYSFRGATVGVASDGVTPRMSWPKAWHIFASSLPPSERCHVHRTFNDVVQRMANVSARSGGGDAAAVVAVVRGADGGEDGDVEMGVGGGDGRGDDERHVGEVEGGGGAVVGVVDDGMGLNAC